MFQSLQQRARLIASIYCPSLCVLRALCGVYFNFTAKHAEGAKTDFKEWMSEDILLANLRSSLPKPCGFSTPHTRMAAPCVDTPSRGATLGAFICDSRFFKTEFIIIRSLFLFILQSDLQSVLKYPFQNTFY